MVCDHWYGKCIIFHSYQEGGSKAVHIFVNMGQTIVQICSLAQGYVNPLILCYNVLWRNWDHLEVLQNITFVQSINDIKTEKMGKQWEAYWMSW